MSGHFPHPPGRTSEAEVIRRLNMIAARLDGWTAEIKTDLAAKYNPRQPRAPRGTPIGGQWVDSAGGNTGGGRFGMRKPARDPWLHDAMTNKPPHLRRPEDVLEGGGAGSGRSGGLRAPRAPSAPAAPMPKSPIANQVVPKIQKLNRQGADDLQEVMIARSQGRVSAKESSAHMREVADDIEKFLGGKVEAKDIKKGDINSDINDLVILKGDKKFRMDVKNPGRTPDRKGADEPHFHFQQENETGKWVDATDQHKNYFSKD